MSAAASPPLSSASPLRSLVAPAVATLVALAVLIGLGTWQLERKAWKEGLIAQIQSRAYGPPGTIIPEDIWPLWRADQDEFRHVSVSGMFLHGLETPVHGLSPGQGGVRQGFYLFTPLRLPTGGTVMVNRGFVPTELRDPAKRPGSQPPGEVTVTGLVRAPEPKGWFVPENKPGEDQWFTRDAPAIASAKGLNPAPFYVAADDIPNPGGWPKGGQTSLDLPNNHLQYAFTWFGIAATLVGVFGAFAWKRLKGGQAA